MPNSILVQFKQHSLTAIEQNHQLYISASDLAKALGYKSDDAISRIYRRNQDEFSSDMSETVNLTVSGNLSKTVRIFSLRGAHLIAMFSRSKVAKDFRKWVLDVLEKEIADTALGLTSDQARHLQILLDYVDKLENRENEMLGTIHKMKSRLNTLQTFWDEMNAQVEELETKQRCNIDMIRHFHLHKNFILH